MRRVQCNHLVIDYDVITGWMTGEYNHLTMAATPLFTYHLKGTRSKLLHI